MNIDPACSVSPHSVIHHPRNQSNKSLLHDLDDIYAFLGGELNYAQ